MHAALIAALILLIILIIAFRPAQCAPDGPPCPTCQFARGHWVLGGREPQGYLYLGAAKGGQMSGYIINLAPKQVNTPITISLSPHSSGAAALGATIAIGASDPLEMRLDFARGTMNWYSKGGDYALLWEKNVSYNREIGVD